MKVIKQLLLITLISSSAWANAAGDIAAGKAKSATCVACHGPQGISLIPTYPNLAGQKPLYVIEQLKAYRDGQRKNMIMAPMAAGLSDKDMENLAAYYASLKPSQ